ncbi:hypothetical protein FIBSPDRAFT_928940 [Athelia psychrophila]|uniref:Uncharacterized protein n=1 Tax=Athelia psychrophila TaxID=1759441 RepID=A0A166PDF2_9AGAM|nr:hypothetical protein FIBSPDRAFT_928940 [Fibularhizoctonia sp. CBS 109695]
MAKLILIPENLGPVETQPRKNPDLDSEAPCQTPQPQKGLPISSKLLESTYTNNPPLAYSSHYISPFSNPFNFFSTPCYRPLYPEIHLSIDFLTPPPPSFILAHVWHPAQKRGSTIMANASCSSGFPSINDLLVQAEAGQVNITTVVSTCQEICTMAWGAGNPDLSGIGLIICYVLQTVLAFLLGPLFCMFYFSFAGETQKNLEELHDTFLDTIAQFSIPVAVATVIRLHQNPPFYEIDFMHSLATMQFLSLLATAVTAGIFDEGQSAIRIIVVCIYGLFNFGFYMGLIGGLRTSAARWEAINELGDACQAYGTLLPGFQAIKKLPGLLPYVNWGADFRQSFKDAFNFKKMFDFKDMFKLDAKELAEFKAVLIIFGMIMAACVCLVIVSGVGWLLWNIFGIWERAERVGPIGLMSLGLSIGTLVELVRMEQIRTIMQHIAGPDFADNQWGFGQIVSLFLWVPVCTQAIYCLLVSFKETGPMKTLIQGLNDIIATLSGPMEWLIQCVDAIIGPLLLKTPKTDAENPVGEKADVEKADDMKTDDMKTDDMKTDVEG